ncbi:hypothetical protein GTG28_07755 [Vibrio sp. OCN044]|uniref:Uncharacterized protein n=1 Tax=Vibrio tetraodonis subsp. pristinus TaxID=2695891 RepID=A0A6L8LSM6_9VIBR|nr:hypothetical protein [Vibrio tetraodonis]MYM59114.1 hypothetical protein [Vibrio tetraodonis subsp. pristinus]
MRYRYYLTALLSFFLFQAQADQRCDLLSSQIEQEELWLSRLDNEFSSSLQNAQSLSAIEQIPSLVFPEGNTLSGNRAWSGLAVAISENTQAVGTASNTRKTQFQRLAQRTLSRQLLHGIAEGLSAGLDVITLIPWYDRLVRTMWDDSATALDRLAVTLEPIPFIGFAVSYYDTLSHMDSPQKRLERFASLGHYTYANDNPETLINRATATHVYQQYQQLKNHTNELAKRIISVHMLHYDATFSAKVLEIEKVLDDTFAQMDSEYMHLMLNRYNSTEHLTHDFGERACINERQLIESNLQSNMSTSLTETQRLRECTYQSLIQNLMVIGVGRSRLNEQARSDFFAYKTKMVDQAMSHISSWRKIILDQQKTAIDEAIQSVVTSDDLILYQQSLYQRARSIAINNFSLQIMQRPATVQELSTGRFMVDEGQLVCGIYSCNVYQGREVLFDETKDPLLKRLNQPLVTIDTQAYLSQHYRYAWSENELDEPYINLWTQWQHKNEDRFYALPYLGNPSLQIIEKDMPLLIEVLEEIPEHLSAQQALPYMYRSIREIISSMDTHKAWVMLGDFVFRFQYELRQQQKLHFLPVSWQQLIWPSSLYGPMYNAYLSKPYWYLSSQSWAQSLPHYDERFPVDWFLQMGEGHRTYLTEPVDRQIYLSDKYWHDVSAQLYAVLNIPAIRWRPFEHLVLMDIWSQLIENEALIAASQS